VNEGVFCWPGSVGQIVIIYLWRFKEEFMMKKMFVVLSAIIVAIAFAIPAGATDWDFYGSVRMQTFRVDQDEDASATGYDDEDSIWGLNPISRVGATVQNGDIGGRFEYGHVNDNVTLRRLYGTWNFGPGELLVGKEYTPLHFVANQVYDNDYGLRGFGGFFTFNPMIQLKIDGFKLALIQPGVERTIQNTTVGTTTADDLDTTFPKLEVSYTHALDNVSLKVFGGINQFDAVDVDILSDNEDEYDITSYIYGVAGVVNTGPVTLKAMIWGGQNVDIYGLTSNPEADAAPKFDRNDNEIKDNYGYGGIASVGVKFNDVVGAELGVGYICFEDDIDNAEDDEALAIYLQAPITLAQGVTIVPEIGQYDYMENAAEVDEGKELYFGAKWQINF